MVDVEFGAILGPQAGEGSPPAAGIGTAADPDEGDEHLKDGQRLPEGCRLKPCRQILHLPIVARQRTAELQLAANDRNQLVASTAPRRDQDREPRGNGSP